MLAYHCSLLSFCQQFSMLQYYPYNRFSNIVKGFQLDGQVFKQSIKWNLLWVNLPVSSIFLFSLCVEKLESSNSFLGSVWLWWLCRECGRRTWARWTHFRFRRCCQIRPTTTATSKSCLWLEWQPTPSWNIEKVLKTSNFF